MIRNTLLWLPAALMCLAAAPVKPAPAPISASAKASATKPVPPRATPSVATFDAQNPQGFMELLGGAGAKVQTRSREGDAVFVTVSSTAAAFSMQFAGCNPQGRACRAVLLDATLDRASITGAQINAFNQTSVMCRIYQDRTGLQHVLFSAILSRSMTKDDAATHLQAWQGCLADGHDFLKDPVSYLANSA